MENFKKFKQDEHNCEKWNRAECYIESVLETEYGDDNTAKIRLLPYILMNICQNDGWCIHEFEALMNTMKTFYERQLEN